MCGHVEHGVFPVDSAGQPEPEPMKGRSKQGQEWARKAAELLAADPGQMAIDILVAIYKMRWRSKRHSVFVQGVRAAWTTSQWWVEMNEEDFRRTEVQGGKRWDRCGHG